MAAQAAAVQAAAADEAEAAPGAAASHAPPASEGPLAGAPAPPRHGAALHDGAAGAPYGDAPEVAVVLEGEALAAVPMEQEE